MNSTELSLVYNWSEIVLDKKNLDESPSYTPPPPFFFLLHFIGNKSGTQKVPLWITLHFQAAGTGSHESTD